MSAAALIKFVQGATTGPDGQMIAGVVGNFNVHNSNNTGVGSWQIDLVYVPPGSALPVSVAYAFSDSSATPDALVPADVTGCYRFVLSVWAAGGRSGPATDIDIRIFGIREPNGTLIPPSQLTPPPLPIESGKPDEFNLNGNAAGWAGNGVDDGLLNHTLKRLDRGDFTGVNSAPADFVMTTNDALTGLGARDGFTPTDGKIGLAVAQTDTTKNGYWVAHAGAFTRPAFFSLDAQVIPGYITQIQNGSLGKGTNWQLKTGNTIAGAKVYVRQSATFIAPVQWALSRPAGLNYSVVRDIPTKTLTFSVGAAVFGCFDGGIPVLGDRVEYNSGGALAPENGIYVVTRVDNGTTLGFVLTRAAEVTAVDLGSGYAFEVLKGVRYGGKRRVQLVQGAITLETTPLGFGDVGSVEWRVLDVAKDPRYQVRAQGDGDWAAAGNPDYGAVITKAIFNAPANTIIQLPGLGIGSNLGDTIHCRTPILVKSNAKVLAGSGIANTTITRPCVGPMIVWDLTDPLTINGATVDDGTGDPANAGVSQSVQLWTPGAPNIDPYFDLSTDGIGAIDAWTNLEIIICAQFDHVPATLSSFEHIVSCRGARLAGIDARDACFSLGLFTNSSSQTFVSASLRTTDATRGAYGTITYVGTHTSTVTGDGTVKPTEDTSVEIMFTTGGTVGTTGMFWQYRRDGGPWSQATALGTANSITISENHFTAKVQLGAGTITTGLVVTVPCSGVNVIASIGTTPGGVVAGTKYMIRAVYNGTTFKLYCTALTGGRTTDASPGSAALSGNVQQHSWESTCLGGAFNSGLIGAERDVNAAGTILGAIQISKTAHTVPANEPTSIVADVTGQQLYWRPNTIDCVKLPDNTVAAWIGHTRANIGLDTSAFLVPRGNHTFDNLRDFGIRDLTVQNQQSGATGIGIYVGATSGGTFENLVASNFARGIVFQGPNFFSKFGGLKGSCTGGLMGIFFCNGEYVLTQEVTVQAGRIQLAAFAASIQATRIFTNTAIDIEIPVLLSNMQGSEISLIIDEEDQTGQPATYAREFVRLSINTPYCLELSGVLGGIGFVGVPLVVGSQSTQGGRVTLRNLTIRGPSGGSCAINILNPEVIPIVVERSVAFSGGVRATNRPANLQLLGEGDPFTTLTDASTTQNRINGKRFRVPDSLAASRSYTAGLLAVIGLERFGGVFFQNEQQEYFCPTVQSFDWLVLNGGPAGGTIATVPAGKKARVIVETVESIDGKINWVAVSVVLW